MSKTERKWLKEVFIALSKFLKELAKLLREFRLFLFDEPNNSKYWFWNKVVIIASIVAIVSMWIITARW